MTPIPFENKRCGGIQLKCITAQSGSYQHQHNAMYKHNKGVQQWIIIALQQPRQQNIQNKVPSIIILKDTTRSHGPSLNHLEMRQTLLLEWHICVDCHWSGTYMRVVTTVACTCKLSLQWHVHASCHYSDMYVSVVTTVACTCGLSLQWHEHVSCHEWHVHVGCHYRVACMCGPSSAITVWRSGAATKPWQLLRFPSNMVSGQHWQALSHLESMVAFQTFLHEKDRVPTEVLGFPLFSSAK